MNDDKRLKEAFRKIKQDMFVLSKQIDEIKGSKVSTKTEIKTDFDKKKFENFVNNVEKELGDLNLYLKEFDDRIKHISKKIEISDKEREDIKNKSLLNQSSSQSNKSDIELFDERFGEFSEILNEKVTLEISSLRLEFTEEVANLYDKFFNEILDLKHEITKKQKKEEKSSKKAEKETEIKKETIKEIPAPVEK
ncbi:MAG: hypothetical protein PF569_07440 [Candidatus Woesearchaeota archaeon]|jgi:hypothetical protein|nr:hypothetical protein [Candidatus Woesearchaeota archaeon]